MASEPGQTEPATLPVALQAQLLARVAYYDRNFSRRAGERANVLLVVKSGNKDSLAAASYLSAALRALPDIGGLPHEEYAYTYAGADALARACQEKRVAIAVFGPGFDGDVEAIGGALTGVNVLTVASGARYVPHGIVLGFDVVSGRPRMVVHLTQARKQHVDLRADALKLMRVYP